jgi:hypothetical protein
MLAQIWQPTNNVENFLSIAAIGDNIRHHSELLQNYQRLSAKPA